MSLLLDALRRSENEAVTVQSLPTAPVGFVPDGAGAQVAAKNLLDAQPQSPASGRRVRVLAGVAGVMAVSMAGWLGWEYWISSQAPAFAVLSSAEAPREPPMSGADGNVPAGVGSLEDPRPAPQPPVALAGSGGPGVESSASVPAAEPALPAPAAVVGQAVAPVVQPQAARRRTPGVAATSRASAEKIPPVVPPSAPPLLVRSDANRQLQDAWMALSQGDAQRSLVLYREVLTERPDDPDATLGVAVALHQQKDLAQAWAAYQRSLKLWPDNATARTGMLAILAESDVVTAESRLSEWVQSRPGDAAAQAALGNLLARQSRWAEALPWLLRAQSLEPRRAAYAYNVAVAFDQSRRFSEAAQNYRLALQLGGGGVSAASVNERLQELAGLESQ